MPETKTFDVTARQLQVGDVLHSGAYTVTGRPDAKQKYVYVPVNDGDTARFRIDESLKVSREVPTAEELETSRIERAHEWIREEMLAAAYQVEKARADLVESLVMKDITWHARRWEAYATAQIVVELWESVVKVAVVQEVDLIEATLMWRKEIAKRLLADLRHARWSSSAFANAAVGLVAQVQAEWVDDLRWYVVR
jgi:hypothetical protein